MPDIPDKYFQFGFSFDQHVLSRAGKYFQSDSAWDFSSISQVRTYRLLLASKTPIPIPVFFAPNEGHVQRARV